MIVREDRLAWAHAIDTERIIAATDIGGESAAMEWFQENRSQFQISSTQEIMGQETEMKGRAGKDHASNRYVQEEVK